MQDASPKPDSSQSPAANWAETAPTSCWQHLHHVPTSSLLHKIKHAEKIEIPLKLKKKKKPTLWLQTDVGSSREAPCQEQRAKGSSVARKKGRGREEAVLDAPRRHDPLPLRVCQKQPFPSLRFGQADPSRFKETSQFVSFPFGACQFVTDCRNP